MAHEVQREAQIKRQELERETVRTDVHSAQHALNERYELLAHVRARLDEMEADLYGDSESPAAPIVGSMDSPGI